jgi:DNA polymerase-3 subunit epsilon
VFWRLRNFAYRVTLGDHAYRFLFEGGPPNEAVAIDCETTGLNPRRDELIEVAAIRIRDNVIATSEAFRAVVRTDRAPTEASIRIHGIRAQDVAAGREMHRLIPELLRFIGGRPIVGYYVDFDVAMLDKYVLPFIEAKLPNPRIDISSLYYALKYRDAPPGTVHDLRFASILADLGLPTLEQHDAHNDALMAAMAYVQLRDMQARGARIRREPTVRQQLPFGA